jgi:hypothetical protein
LQNLGIPAVFTVGKIGHLSIEVPWSTITFQPIQVHSALKSLGNSYSRLKYAVLKSVSNYYHLLDRPRPKPNQLLPILTVHCSRLFNRFISRRKRYAVGSGHWLNSGLRHEPDQQDPLQYQRAIG